MLTYHRDMSNQESIKLFKRIENITTEFSEAESFVSPEISKIDDSKLEEFLLDEKMTGYEKSIRDIMKEKKHILSEEVEKVLAMYSEVFSNCENTYDIFTNTEFEFPKAEDKDGNLSDKKTSGVTAEQFADLQKYMYTVIKQISKEILGGNIDLKPYYKDKKTPCKYCDYKSVCGFNMGGCENSYNYIDKSWRDYYMTFDSIVDLIRKTIDVLLVWLVLYYVLKSLSKNVKMVLLFKGIFIIIVLKIFSDLLLIKLQII